MRVGGMHVWRSRKGRGRKLGAKNEDGDGEEILHCNPVCCSTTLVSRVLAARGKMMTFLALLDRNLVYSSEGNAGFLEYVFYS